MKKGFNLIEVAIVLIIIAIISLIVVGAINAAAQDPKQSHHYTIASYYASDKMECASRDFKVGTLLRVSHGGKSILVPVTNVGPSKDMYDKGRHLDLSKLAFSQLDNPDVGLIEITVEER